MRHGVAAVEAAVMLPVLLIFMLGIWQVARLVQVNQIVTNAAYEAARLAAGGTSGGTNVTAAMVATAAQNYMTAAGLPSTAVNNAQVTLTCLATPAWTDPYSANPLDPFTVTVTIPAGAPFNSLQFTSLANIAHVTQLTTTVTWYSLNDLPVTVSSTIPY
jgi:Flp pilus assembly protein TadG